MLWHSWIYKPVSHKSITDVFLKKYLDFLFWSIDIKSNNIILLRTLRPKSYKKYSGSKNWTLDDYDFLDDAEWTEFEKTSCQEGENKEKKGFVNGIEIEKWDDTGRFRNFGDYKGITSIRMSCSESSDDIESKSDYQERG